LSENGTNMIAEYQVHGTVAVIVINNPPMNVLSHEVRKAIVDNLERAIADDAVKAVVIGGAGAAFSAGADIRELNTPKATAEPHIHSVIRAVEESPKPVIAAIHAVCMGAGLELALGCHYRIAARGTVMAQPEVKLGLCPGAGATQRLPRVVGIETALNMIVSGEPVKSEQLVQTRIFDSMAEGDLIEEAIGFAERISTERRSPPKLRDIKVEYPDHEAFFGFARNSIKAAAAHYPAPLRCVDAIQAAITMDFDEGIQHELDIFFELMATRPSKALIHAFFAEKAASKNPDLREDTPVRPVRKAAVIGAGMMGSGIAMSFANAGISATVLEVNQEALDRGLAKIRAIYEDSVKRGRLSRQDLEQRISLLSTTLEYRDIADADIVVEAVFEDIAVKKGVFEKLDAAMKPGAILATNTSTLDLNRIAGFTRRPQDVIGAHFFSPAQVMKLLEVVRGKATARDVLATVMKLARKLKKTAVVSGVCDGFIGNRMMEQYARQAEFLLEEGCTPEQVDKAIEKFGFAMGPFRVADLVGNDVVLHIRNRWGDGTPRVRYSRLPALLYEMKRLGQKSGAGWYDYMPGSRHALPSPAVNEMIRKHRETLGIAARQADEKEIVERLVFALVNEGARILEEGISLRASDIDIVYLMGYGFPPWRGGPMFYADTIGLRTVLSRMKQFAADPNSDPEFWKPASLLARLASEATSFHEQEGIS
jgi:3-hydroxyacyl-CoA dehydrogenase